MVKRTLTMKIRVEGVRETLAAFRRLPKDASAELRDAAERIAQAMANSARAASNIDPQAAAVGTTIKVARDRVPAVQIGGTQKVTSRGVPAWQLLFGAEFGMNSRSGWYAASKYEQSEGRQFRSAHRGREGRFFFPTLEREVPTAIREWRHAADEIARRWSASSGAGG